MSLQSKVMAFTLNLTYCFTASDVLAEVADDARQIDDVFNVADSMAALCYCRQDGFRTFCPTRTICTHLPQQTKNPTLQSDHKNNNYSKPSLFVGIKKHEIPKSLANRPATNVCSHRPKTNMHEIT